MTQTVTDDTQRLESERLHPTPAASPRTIDLLDMLIATLHRLYTTPPDPTPRP